MFLKILTGRKREQEKVDALRHTFKDRYHHFKLLLDANNQAMEILTEIDVGLKGVRPFSMTFVQNRCTMILQNVLSMIKHLDSIAPKKYEPLFRKHEEIHTKITHLIQDKNCLTDGPMLLTLSDVESKDADLVGAKMFNLSVVQSRLGLQVPNGFIISAAAFQRFMDYNNLQPKIEESMQVDTSENLEEREYLCEAIQKLILDATIPPDLEKEIHQFYRELEKLEKPNVPIAIRSSAIGEDLLNTSFAGQFVSFLNVSKDEILNTYKKIIASKYSMSAMSYQLSRGIKNEDVVMCAGCLIMIDAVSGGVAYSRNPVVSNDDSIIVNSTWGLPKYVVDGGSAVDLFTVRRGDSPSIIQKVISVKNKKYTCNSDKGISLVDVPNEAGLISSLSDEQVLDLAKMVEGLESFHEYPQDVEWAIDQKGKIIILQCRPLAQVANSVIEPDIDNEDVIKADVILHEGITASPGSASGPVFIARWDKQALHLPAGAVLVTSQALPSWAMLLDRASAVITEEGTITGHLANVAREFGVPAIFEVKRATEILRDGQIVTVNANARKVYDGRVDLLLKEDAKPKSLMQGSKVYEALRLAAQNILPLNLLDPDTRSFTPEKCKTLHDITRFCHEKSVMEIFDFGKLHNFRERSSKQLFIDRPLKWWVLNLDDGFENEIEGKYVKLDNIVSLPMLALWNGITWKNWEGPPPVDGRGLMSVMFQATANTAILESSATQYADRNYFMISKNFCNLTSRLGFHFSIVETMVGEASSDNYIAFQFKGGAADIERKLKRLEFLKEILMDYGFIVEVRGDYLRARLDNLDQNAILERLRVIGYITIHTRQLDMIMTNPTTVNHYKLQIAADLKEMISSAEITQAQE